jgi:2-polyprenyl-6-methoxyphenol hydroxylase-like FAD-dependent oxidoreductase
LLIGEVKLGPGEEPEMKRALIIGGSMGGLFAALMLRKIGWEAEVFERVASRLVSRGAGIATHRELLATMRDAGVPVNASLGVEVRDRVMLDRNGHVTGEVAMPQLVTSWSHLYDVLLGGLPTRHYHQNRQLVRLEQTADQVTASFADGSKESGDLLIGADGIHSTVRSLVMPDEQPIYAGYVAWRGLVGENELSPAAQHAIAEKFAFCMPPGEQILGYPVPGPENRVAPGHRSYNFVWYRPADEPGRLAELLTDRLGRPHELSIPHDQIRSEVIARMRDDGAEVLAPPFAELVRRAPAPFIQAICDLESRRMASGRVALIGDAAFVARPHPGMGVTKAALDAAALARALAKSPARIFDALEEFSAERRMAGTAVVERGRYLGRLIRTVPATDAERQRIGREILIGTATSTWS